MAKQILNHAGAGLQRILDQYRAVLADRNMALLLGAGVISELGDWFNTVALISLAYGFGDRALGVGGMFAVRMLVRLIFQGPAGAIVDRHAGRQLLFIVQLSMAVIAGAFTLLVVVPKLWLLYLLVMLLEVANCIARPAFMVELKAEAPEEQRPAANGALLASMTTAQLIGPLLGTLVLVPFGAAAVFMLNGLTFLGVAAAVTQLRGGLNATTTVGNARGGSNPPVPVKPEPETMGYWWLLRRQDLSLYLLVSLSLTLLVQAAITLFIVRSLTLGLDDAGVGYFYAAVAVGSIAGSVVAGARPQIAASLYPAAVAIGIGAIALAVFGVVSTVLLAIVALVMAGFATDFCEVVGLTYFQAAIPDTMYGRFYSVFFLALSAGALVGAVAGPVLEQMLGVAVTLVILAAPSVTFALVLALMSRTWLATERARGN
jgi:MFS family permease